MLRLTKPNYLKIIILPVQAYPTHTPAALQTIVTVLPLAVYPAVQVATATYEYVVAPEFSFMEAAFVIEGTPQSRTKIKQI